jgi:CubicO group peptidase (beta-lactamase class C family)
LLEAGHILRRHGRSGWFSYIPAPLLREATTGTPANRMYGMGFWLNANARRAGATERDVEEALGAGLAAADWARACLSRQAPPDLIAMVGSRGQRVYVVPSRNQVIIRLGRTPGFRDPEFLAALY